MGRKITIDSATLFNKGLEMIEARWLFDIEMARVGVVVHPQSVVHSMVEFVDGSMLAQLSTPDMCLPIQYALTYPDRAPSGRVQTNLAKLGSLTFEEPDAERFPALELARRAGEIGGTLPAVLNAANEVAVEAFVNQQNQFPANRGNRSTHDGRAQSRSASDVGANSGGRRLGTAQGVERNHELSDGSTLKPTPTDSHALSDCRLTIL